MCLPSLRPQECRKGWYSRCVGRRCSRRGRSRAQSQGLRGSGGGWHVLGRGNHRPSGRGAPSIPVRGSGIGRSPRRGWTERASGAVGLAISPLGPAVQAQRVQANPLSSVGVSLHTHGPVLGLWHPGTQVTVAAPGVAAASLSAADDAGREAWADSGTAGRAVVNRQVHSPVPELSSEQLPRLLLGLGQTPSGSLGQAPALDKPHMPSWQSSQEAPMRRLSGAVRGA